MSLTQQQRAAAKAELARRIEAEGAAAIAALTPLKAVTTPDGRVHQRALDAINDILDTSLRRHAWMCSRRAAKTNNIAITFERVAQREPRSNLIFFSITKGQAVETFWTEVWLPYLEKHRIPCRHNESNHVTTFRNGSRVVMAGTDDLTHVKTYLGNRLKMVAIDEMQDQPPEAVEHLVNVVLPPALSDHNDGILLLAGTIPDVAAGFWWKVWSSKLYNNHSWARWDNPFLTGQEEALAEFLRSSGLTLEDPITQRDWFGKEVFSASLTAYRYIAARNSYTPLRQPWESQLVVPDRSSVIAAIPPSGCDTFALGLDTGAAVDRCAIVVWAWNQLRPREIYQIFEWVTPKAANTTQSQYMSVVVQLRQRYGLMRCFYDYGSSKTTIDTLLRDYQVLLEPADKTGLHFQVERFASLLGEARAHVIAGSFTEIDLQKSRWDPTARANGKWKWSRIHKADASDAARMGLEGYFAGPVEERAPKVSPADAQRLRDEEAERALFAGPPVARESWDDGGYAPPDER